MALTETWITDIKVDPELIYGLVPHDFTFTIYLGKERVRGVVELVFYIKITFLYPLSMVTPTYLLIMVIIGLE